MFEGIERAGVAVRVVDAKSREELKDLLFDGRVGCVECRGQFSHILFVLHDVIQADPRIHCERFSCGTAANLYRFPLIILREVDVVESRFHSYLKLPTCYTNTRKNTREIFKRTAGHGKMFS